MRIFSCWGKAQGGWHLLPYHCLDVAACAVTLLRRNARIRSTLVELTRLGDGDLEALIGWAAALHDIGKLSPAFQWQVPEVAGQLGQPPSRFRYDVRHDSLGWVLWHQRIGPDLEPDENRRTNAHLWVRCATGHHGVPPSRMPEGRLVRVQSYFDESAVDAGFEWAQFAYRQFSPRLDAGTPADLGAASWWIAGLITLADWLGSSIEWFPYLPEKTDLGSYWQRALDQAQIAVAESGLGVETHQRTFAQIFPTFTPTKVQATVAAMPRTGPFLLIVEEATGGGKTEAALAAAGGDAFYFGLPTMATANGLWDRVGEIGGQQVLLHSRRWLLPKAMERAEAWINDSRRKSILASIGVGTVDQAMLAVLHTRYNALRLTGLSGRTLIIDEVHAYDPYMTGILERLIEFHARAGGAVVLLSATMALSVRQTLSNAWARGRGISPPRLTHEDFPLVSYVDAQHCEQTAVPSYRNQTIRIERIVDEEALIDRISAATQEGQCVAWIRNTVREAVEAFDRLRGRNLDVDLFHARFTNGDRGVIEKRVLQCYGKKSTPALRCGKVLVATQVVEQSLDLDFDLMVTDLAPIDLIIQRAGRLHRHDRGYRGMPRLLIFAPPWMDAPPEDWVAGWSSGTSVVYPDHGRLWLTLQILGEEIELPRDARRLVEGVYGITVVGRIPPGLAGSVDRVTRKMARMGLQAETNAIASNSQYIADGVPKWDDEVAPTRLGLPSREWVLCAGGVPLNETVELSAVSIPSARLVSGPAEPGVRLGPWQKSLRLVNGEADCEAAGGTRIRVSYDSRRGLVF